MFASLAAIQVAYLVAMHSAVPSAMPYQQAGNAIVAKLGTKAATKLFAQCTAAVKANPYPATYASMAQQVIAQRTTVTA